MKRRGALTVSLAVILALGMGGAAIALSRGSDDEPLRGSLPPPGIALPLFDLPDQAGRFLHSRELTGRAVLVTFLDTQCTESCPIIASVIGRALDLLEPAERQRVTAIAISTDPDEDTRESIAAFLRRHGVEGRLHYLVAPVPELRPVWDAFQIAASVDTGEDSLHSAPVRLYDMRGIWIATQHAGADLTAANLAHDIRAILADR